MISEAQKRAGAKYDAANTIRVSLKLNKNTDADIIEWLAGKDSKAGAIKDAIRRGMNR